MKEGSAIVGEDSSTDEQLNDLMNRSRNADFERQVIQWTENQYRRCRAIRQQVERQWYLNLAFYMGRQNVSAMPVQAGSSSVAGVRLYVPPAPYYRSRPVINRIRPAVRTELSRLTSQKPTATIVPATGEDQDLSAAQAGEQLWESIYREKKIHRTFRETMYWALTTGNGFLKSYWHPDMKSKSGEMGDFCFETVTPFHIFVPDMMAEDIEDQPFVIQIQTKTIDAVEMKYGFRPEPNCMAATDILNDSFLNIVGASDFQKNAVLCYEVWVKPGHVKMMPQGGMFTIVGNRLVQFIENNPYIHGQYPFTKFPHLPTGNFYAESVISDLVPIQREYNRTRGQINEAKNRMGHPQVVAAQGSVDASKMTTEPGQVIEYKLGFPEPKPFPLQGLPNYILQEIDRHLMDFEDISGQHQVSKGQVPSGVTAATAINFLQEQDESMLSTTFAAIEEGFEKIGYQTLCYVKQYWEVPRQVKVVGRDGSFNVMAFQGADIRDNTDIRIESGSALPTSKSAKQAFLMDMMTQGFIPPEKGLELMDVGGVQRLYDEIKVDFAQASRENMKMAAVTQQQLSEYMQTFLGAPDPETGQPSLIDPSTGGPLVDGQGNPTAPPLIVPVNSFDAHQAHIQTHNSYRKSQEYEQLPTETKALFEAHVNQHMQALGLIPGTPAPQDGQNAVTSGGMDSGQMPPEMLQSIAMGGGMMPPSGPTPPGGGMPPGGPNSGPPMQGPPPNSGPPNQGPPPPPQ